MSRTILTPLVLGLSVLMGATKGVGAAELSIDRIEENNEIVGYVTDARDLALGELKVIVYVKTDRWYIHPYAGQGEGLSWASISSSGEWRIETVKRKFVASEVAALLVDKAYTEPHHTDTLHRIPHEAITVIRLEGTEDDGKL